MKHTPHLFYLIAGLCTSYSCNSKQAANKEEVSKKPNIIIIMADDMGYSDIGCFGSEIATPNLDKMAVEGLRMTRFYNASRCCPSRASFLTGQYPHAAGMGGMTDSHIDLPSYQGYLNNNCVTIANVLKSAGYSTFTSGKWHVGHAREHWPHNYGFDRIFSSIKGAGSYFDGKPYRNSDWPWSDPEIIYVRDSNRIEYPEGEYLTDLITENAVKYIEESKDNPFFLYMAYTAPHWPLHALPEDIAKYEGKYMIGWDSLRKQRYQKQLELGVIHDQYDMSKRDERVKAWDSLTAEEKTDMDRRMAVYAAMIDRMDQGIGKVITQLEASGKMDNTIIFFLSDNGGASALHVGYLHERFDPDAPIGSPQSFEGYGRGWANVSNTPFREGKATAHEGGISTPFIAWYPGRIKAGKIDHQPAHIVDFMATCVDLAGAEYPEQKEGVSILPMEGVSLLPLFNDEKIERKKPLYTEHFANLGIQKDNWKLVKLRNEPWELFDMENDRTETNNLINSAEPGVIKSLLEDFRTWETRVGVFPQDIVDSRTKLKD